VFLPVAYAGISKWRASRLEKFGKPEAGSLGAKPPDAGGYGGLGAKSPATEENLQFWGQNLTVLCISWSIFDYFIAKVSTELYGINGLPVPPKLWSILCVHKINSVLNNYINFPSPDGGWTRVPYVNLENLVWVTMWICDAMWVALSLGSHLKDPSH